MKTINFLAESNHIEKLEKLKDSLVRLNESVEWEGFRQPIEKAIRKDTRGRGGRPAYDAVLMFKVLILLKMKKNAVSSDKNSTSRELESSFLCS